jgi:hypothetical protein
MSRPALSVVILSRGEATLEEAIRSVAAQDATAEIVVSHSGPSLGARLTGFPGLRLLSSERPLTPGGARNAGVRGSTGEFVAFLAADCTALPGWVRSRIDRHQGGARAVASAMAAPNGPPAALASHLIQHSSRMPHLHPSPRLRFGVSYARDLLDEVGPFPEDLPGEEDVILNGGILARGVAIEFAPEVRSTHRYPTTIGELVADSARRGHMRHRIRSARQPRAGLVARALLDGGAGAWRAARPGSEVARRDLARACPALAAGTLAYAAGVARSRSATRGKGQGATRGGAMDDDTRTEDQKQSEEAQAKVDALEEDPPEKIEDWPDDDAKYKTFGGPEGDTSYEEGATAKLGESEVRHHDDGSVTVKGEKVDNPDEYKGDPIPGGPTDPNAASISGERNLADEERSGLDDDEDSDED